MNRILNEIKSIIKKNLNEYLPDVKNGDLEEDGMVYYMNGKNGTEFEWYVNEQLPSFMVFYNDKQNLGAVKLSIHTNGEVALYIYGDRGKKIVKEVNTFIEIEENELFSLAVILKNEADDNKIWDASIDKINTDIEANDEQIERFKKSEEDMRLIKNRFETLYKMAYVSNRIIEDGWKVGFMYREQALNENDSGWAFMAGNEDDEYASNSKNITLLSVNQVCQLDPDIWNYIYNPVGTKLIRISSNEFEIDKNDKEIYTEKRVI